MWNVSHLAFSLTKWVTRRPQVVSWLPSNTEYCTFSWIKMHTSGLLSHCTSKPLFPPPPPTSLIIELRVPPGGCTSESGMRNETAVYPTLVCNSFDIHFELICHEANNWEDDKACKYTCGTVGTCDYQCVPVKKTHRHNHLVCNTQEGVGHASNVSHVHAHILWEHWQRQILHLSGEYDANWRQRKSSHHHQKSDIQVSIIHMP